MKKFSIHMLFAAAGLAFALSAAHAQAPAGAPPGSTVQCNDGTFASPATRRGACRGHKGVKTWFGAADGAAPAAAAKAPAAAPAAAAPAPAPAPATASRRAARSASTPAATVAPGGGGGKVWVNLETKVYHCEGDRWYGRTRKGEYMTQAQAQAQGARAARAKACS
jgi:hypothetical protein